MHQRGFLGDGGSRSRAAEPGDAVASRGPMVGACWGWRAEWEAIWGWREVRQGRGDGGERHVGGWAPVVGGMPGPVPGRR